MTQSARFSPAASSRSGAPAGGWLVVAGSVLFGTIGTARALGPDAPQVTVAAARMVLAAGLLAALTIRSVRTGSAFAPAGFGRAARLPAVWVAGVSQAAFQWCFLSAVTRAGVAVGTLVAIGLAPVITAALSRRVDRTWVMATGVGLVGLVLLVGFGPVGEASGLFFAVGAAASYAVYIVASTGVAHAQEQHGLRLATTLTVIFSIAMVLLLIPALATGPWTWLTTPPGAAMTVYLALLPTVAAYHLFNAGLRTVPARTAATLALTEPVVATALGVVVLGERLTSVATVGALLVLVAVLVLVRAPAPAPTGAR